MARTAEMSADSDPLRVAAGSADLPAGAPIAGRHIRKSAVHRGRAPGNNWYYPFAADEGPRGERE